MVVELDVWTIDRGVEMKMNTMMVMRMMRLL